ncbi:MAG: M13 family peptidase, partial [Spirosomataceae bacterium]
MKKRLLFCLALCFSVSAVIAQKTSISGMDSSVKPGDDFFMHVNGNWYNSIEIPSTQSGVGAYSFMNYPQRIRMQAILDSVSSIRSKTGSIEHQVGDFSASGV